MAKSTTWWLAWIAMLLVGTGVAALINSSYDPTGLTVAHNLGWSIGVAIPAVLFAAFTRFRRVWLPVVVWAVTISVAVLGATIGRPSLAASTPAPGQYFTAVTASISRCVQKYHSPLRCYPDASPKRCQQQAVNLFNTDLEGRQRTWAVCVESCAGSSAPECRSETY